VTDLDDRPASAPGTTVADLLPAAEPPDSLMVLKGRARSLFDDGPRTADRETPLAPCPPVARLVEPAAPARGR
jgi:hypothetical protein